MACHEIVSAVSAKRFSKDHRGDLLQESRNPSAIKGNEGGLAALELPSVNHSVGTCPTSKSDL